MQGQQLGAHDFFGLEFISTGDRLKLKKEQERSQFLLQKTVLTFDIQGVNISNELAVVVQMG